MTTDDAANPLVLVRQRASADDGTQFVGSVDGQRHCRSTMTLAHELGHAVEAHTYRRASIARAKAVEAQIAAFDAYNGASAAYYPRVLGPYRDLLNHHSGALAAGNIDLANALGSLYSVAGQAIVATQTAIDTVATQAADRASVSAVIEEVKATLIEQTNRVGAEAKRHSQLPLPWQPLLTAFVSAQKAIAQALNNLNATVLMVLKADAFLKTVVSKPPGGQIRSKRLVDFIEFVGRFSPEDQRRLIGITPYAKAEWAKNPRELFAEAYALWITDKPFLTRVAPEFLTYFSKGMHLK